MAAFGVVENEAFAHASIILASLSVADRRQAVRALPLNQAETGMLDAAMTMDGADIRALLLGRSAGWLVLAGDPLAGVGVCRALKGFWTVGGRYDPQGGAARLVEYGDAVCGMAAGCLRGGDTGSSLQIVAAHGPELGSSLQGTRLTLIGVAAHLQRSERDLARALLPLAMPQLPALGIEWRRLRALLDGDDGDAPESIAEQWARAVGSLDQLVALVVQTAAAPQAMGSLLRTRLDEERRKTPVTKAELVTRLTDLRQILEQAMQPRSEPPDPQGPAAQPPKPSTS